MYELLIASSIIALKPSWPFSCTIRFRCFHILSTSNTVVYEPLILFINLPMQPSLLPLSLGYDSWPVMSHMSYVWSVLSSHKILILLFHHLDLMRSPCIQTQQKTISPQPHLMAIALYIVIIDRFCCCCVDGHHWLYHAPRLCLHGYCHDAWWISLSEADESLQVDWRHLLLLCC